MPSEKELKAKAKKKKVQVKFAFKPYELQQEIIDYLDGKHLNEQGNEYRFLVAALGRQSGKSWLAKYILLDRAINRDQVCMWVAPAIPTARTHWNALVKLIKDSGMEEAGFVKKISQAAKEIQFVDGGVIQVRSAIEPDNLRGDSLDLLIMDEAAFFRNGDYVWYSVCLPMITATKGKVLFTTTPNGRNWVYDLFKHGQNPKDPYHKSWNVPSEASPYQDKELLEYLKQNMPSLKWREEFMAEFLADGGGVFAGVELAANVQQRKAPRHGDDIDRYVAGIDIGFNNDYTVFTVIDTLERKQVYGERFTNVGTVRTVKRIVELLDIWTPKITHIEKNGVGEYLVQLLQLVVSGRDIDDIVDAINDATEDDPDATVMTASIGTHKIKAIHMNNRLKRNLVERLAADIEYGRFNILDEDTCDFASIQISEMSTYERKPTNSGMDITYNAAEGSHDDTIAALYIAYKGVKRMTRKDIMKKIKGDKRKKKKGSPFRSRSLAGRKHRRK